MPFTTARYYILSVNGSLPNFKIATGYTLAITTSESSADGTGNNDGILVNGERVTGNAIGDSVSYYGQIGDGIVIKTVNGSVHLLLSNDIYASGTAISVDTANFVVPCFLRGTRILAARGKVAVEDLRIGDLVVTLEHEFRPIRWIGRRSFARRFLPQDIAADVLPIRIRRGALGHGVPHRDLYLSPAHALNFEDTLIPAQALLNGLSIAPRQDIERIDYFHLLLDRHAVIWAEGAATESYERHGNNLRGFANWAEQAALAGGEPAAEPRDCFPRRHDGPVVARVRAALRARLAAIGFARTDDPALVLLADGVPVQPALVAGRSRAFRLPSRPAALRLASRSTVPAWLDGGADRRRLGVPVRRITLRGQGVTVEIGPGHPGLTDGFSHDEGSHRWTDGDAGLPPALLRALPDGEVTVEVELIDSDLPYHLAPVEEPGAAPAPGTGAHRAEPAAGRLHAACRGRSPPAPVVARRAADPTSAPIRPVTF